MRIKHLLTKTLLVAAGLGVGATSAWADDYYTTSTTDGVTTTTMNFNVYSGTVARTQSVATTLGATEITTSQSQKVYPVNDYSNFKMFNYIAMASNYGIRRGSSSVPTAASISDGIFCASRTTQYVSVINLHVGDKVRFTCSNNITVRSGNATYLVDDVPTNTTTKDAENNDVFANANVGELTIVGGNQLDLQLGRDANSNLSIGSVTIISQYDAVSTPTLEQTAAGSTSTILITAGACNNSGATVTTYYTTDGSEPSADHYEGSFTTASKSIDITSNKTIKAVSVTSGTYGGSSYVISGDFTAEESTLNAPAIAQTGFSLSGGSYHPVYTFSSDQSGVPGYSDQSLTYSYTLAGGEAVESATCTATTTGKLIVTVSAAGFKSNSAELDIDVVDFLKTYTFDATTDITKNDDAASDGNNTIVDGTGCAFYAIGDCSYTTRRGIAITGLSFAWAITAGKAYGIYGRARAGSISYSLNEGEVIEMTNNGAPVYGYAPATSTNFPQWSLVKQINIYTPVGREISVPVTNGYATYANHDYDLDFSGVSGLTAYTAKVSGDVVTFTPAGKVPAGMGVLLKGETANVPVTTGAAAIDDNVLYAPETAVSSLSFTDGTYNNYILTQPKDKAVGFYRANNNSVAVGKAYLRIESTAAPQFTFIGLDGESVTTGIETVVSGAQMTDHVYNLNGQRVAQPTKGLYIVGGKKAIIK